MNRSIFLFILAGSWACSSKDSHPPEYTFSGIATPRSCGEVRGGSFDGAEIVVDGEAASCPGTGFECPLSDIPAFDGVCTGGKLPVGVCQADKWVVSCVDAPDAGAVDAAADSAGNG